MAEQMILFQCNIDGYKAGQRVCLAAEVEDAYIALGVATKTVAQRVTKPARVHHSTVRVVAKGACDAGNCRYSS